MDINEIIASTISLLSITAEKKHIRLRNVITKKTMVYADKNMINTVIRNLISNAVKFTTNDGEVSISTADKENMVEIRVTDTGVGMNKENLGKLFRIDMYHSTTEPREKQALVLVWLLQGIYRKHGGK
jgi:signal transduction histidine kinase